MTGPLSISQVEGIMEKVRQSAYQNLSESVSVDEVHFLCETALNVLRLEPSLVEIRPPAIICGDIHGQFTDLMKIFTRVGQPPEKNFVFLGNYVDRGRQSLETAVLLFCYKVKYPEKVILLRGNHECSAINRSNGLFDEIAQRYGQQHAQLLWKHFNQAFAWLPYVALVGKRILCVHAGLSPTLHSMDQLRKLRRPIADPPNPSLELDLLWADAEPGIQGFRANTRGASVMFGEDVVANVRKLLDVSLIVRSHQPVKNGAEFFAENRLITIFSAVSYAGHDNSGAVLVVDASMNYTTEFFPPNAE
uniref:Serine/threonine-protein phosphatase n=1 Tax=Globodera pallida TaxID=36090 RepID=A0A183CK13_GLOPA